MWETDDRNGHVLTGKEPVGGDLDQRRPLLLPGRPHRVGGWFGLRDSGACAGLDEVGEYRSVDFSDFDPHPDGAVLGDRIEQVGEGAVRPLTPRWGRVFGTVDGDVQGAGLGSD